MTLNRRQKPPKPTVVTLLCQAKKYFLVLMTGRPTALPRAIGEDVLSCSSGTVGAPLAARCWHNNRMALTPPANASSLSRCGWPCT
jgi:hypothetical protein